MNALNLETLTLTKGGHRDRSNGLCVMEAVAWFAGEPHTDQPVCASPILTSFAMKINDRWDDTARQRLVPFIPRLVGTAGDGQDEARGYLALDWLIRAYTPTWLDLAGLVIEAQALRDLRRVVDLVAAQAAGPVVRSSREKVSAAGDAAWAAAGDAVWAAVWAATGAAAGDAARAAARGALKPTVEMLQKSALDLFDRMIAPAGAA